MRQRVDQLVIRDGGRDADLGAGPLDQLTDERFEVKLSFSNVPERLVVPFAAVKAFYDPSAQFGLQFGKPGAANDSARQHMASALPDLVGEQPEEAREPAAEETAETPHAVVMSRRPAEVVHLDSFRKK